MQLFRPHMRKLGITDQQGRILRVLAECAAIELGELSAQTCIHPASLSRMIPSMQAKGLVRRLRDPVDARRVMVSITKPGTVLFRAIARQSLDIYATVAREIGATRLKELNRSLDSLVAGIGKTDGNAKLRHDRKIARPKS
jgi:homoprotocatechuate degradation regulator HpaR